MTIINVFSTKTPYVFKESLLLNYTDFTPKKIWAIYRHGTRFPGKKIISKYTGLTDVANILQGSKLLSIGERNAFKNWQPLHIDLEHQKYLTKEGEEELYILGQRFRKMFPRFFIDNNSTSFTFKHTPTQRTDVSARKFIEGLFQDESDAFSSIEVARDDQILRPYKNCNLWRTSVKKNPQSLEDKLTLVESTVVENLINEIKEITQIDYLSFKDIELFYTICGFETAWRHQLNGGRSIWCSLFKNENNLKLMEYLEDMEYFAIHGPKYEITRKVACKTVDDMLTFIDASNDEEKLSFYFTHSGTILKLLTFLELYNDNFNLTADKINHPRKWKTSKIDSFSTNVIVVLYDSLRHGPHIQLLHQEEIIKLPFCQSNDYGMCAYGDFMDFYKRKIQNCNLNKICNEKEEL